MRRRSRIRHAVKWTGTGICLLTLLSFVLSMMISLHWSSSPFKRPFDASSPTERSYFVWTLRKGVVAVGVLPEWIQSTALGPAKGLRVVPPYNSASWIWWPGFLYRAPAARQAVEAWVPLYLLFIAVLIPTTYIWYKDRRHTPGHCQNCGYDLTGNETGRCPECATPIIAKQDCGSAH